MMLFPWQVYDNLKCKNIEKVKENVFSENSFNFFILSLLCFYREFQSSLLKTSK